MNQLSFKLGHIKGKKKNKNKTQLGPRENQHLERLDRR